MWAACRRECILHKNRWYGIFKSICFCNWKGSQRVPNSWQSQVFLWPNCNLWKHDMCEHVESICFCKCNGSQRVLNMQTCFVFLWVVVVRTHRPHLCNANIVIVLFGTGPKVDIKHYKCVYRVGAVIGWFAANTYINYPFARSMLEMCTKKIFFMTRSLPAQLSVSHCPCQAETNSLGRNSGSCAK